MQTIASLLSTARAASGRIYITTRVLAPWIKPASDTVRGDCDVATYAQAMGFTEDRLRDLEAGKALPTDAEAHQIARVYGMDAGLLIKRIKREQSAYASSVIRLAALLSEARRQTICAQEKANARWNVLRFSC